MKANLEKVYKLGRKEGSLYQYSDLGSRRHFNKLVKDVAGERQCRGVVCELINLIRWFRTGASGLIRASNVDEF